MFDEQMQFVSIGSILDCFLELSNNGDKTVRVLRSLKAFCLDRLPSAPAIMLIRAMPFVVQNVCRHGCLSVIESR